MIRINWGGIVASCISSLITMVFIGACVIVWKGATTVDDKVNSATKALKDQSEYTAKVVEVVQQELIQIKSNQNEIISFLNSIQKAQPPVYFSRSSDDDMDIVTAGETRIETNFLPNVAQVQPDFIQQQLPRTKALDDFKAKY